MIHLPDQALTVGTFREILDEALDRKIEERLEPRLAAIKDELNERISDLNEKMTQGFETLDRKIDFVDRSLGERIEKIETHVSALEKNSKRRHEILSSQMSSLALTKADWQEE